ncbi:MAG: biopolymer transporter ExbD [Candidatus Competibacteraceae bacterium]|nr:biopolymer transporter ExbD [Candidatus Competibacteraceae bacterium]
MDEEIASINVIPLVDIMLVLLTIVLTTATFIVTGHIPVDLARAQHAAPSQPSPTVLTLTLQRAVYLDDRPVADLPAALADLSRATPVVVRADGGLALRDFIDLVERIKALGFAQVSLEVKRT